MCDAWQVLGGESIDYHQSPLVLWSHNKEWPPAWLVRLHTHLHYLLIENGDEKHVEWWYIQMI